MVKFVVWGAGGRGKIAAEILGIERIVAFIDSDPKKNGTAFLGRPIIDFTAYKEKYTQYAILNSLAADKVVTDILRRENIFFFVYNECPPELIGYGWKKAKEYKDMFSLPNKKIAVYGNSLYSVLVYEYLENAGYNCAGLIYNSQLSEAETESFVRLFPFINVKELREIGDDITILQTVSNFDCGEDLSGKEVIDIYDWKERISAYFNSKIALLHDKYRGKRCFIIATGPSLTFDDLEILNRNHEFCISMNTIFCSFGETAWRPDQYVIVDVDAINKYDSDIRSMDVKEKFIADASMDFDYESLTEEFYVFHSIFTKNTLKQGLISDDFARYAYNSGTVTAVCLQLAIYEGFSEIYLLGCDCSYFQTGLKHFNEPVEMQIDGYGVMDATMELLDSHISSYCKLREFAKHKGVKIYNATRGGYLEVFERVKFDELF